MPATATHRTKLCKQQRLLRATRHIAESISKETELGVMTAKRAIQWDNRIGVANTAYCDLISEWAELTKHYPDNNPSLDVIDAQLTKASRHLKERPKCFQQRRLIMTNDLEYDPWDDWTDENYAELEAETAAATRAQFMRKLRKRARAISFCKRNIHERNMCEAYAQQKIDDLPKNREELATSQQALKRAVMDHDIEAVKKETDKAGLILARHNSRRLSESIKWDVINWTRGEDYHNGQIIGQATLDTYSKCSYDDNGNWQQA